MKTWDKQEEGKCPECNAVPLEHGDHKIEDNLTLYFNVWCDKCNWEGTAVYSLEFYEYVK
ncbi:hypothetical protein KAR91_12330 [Candidatus Pacearchaeota archaeon]|nr:hypothetical protein [Candidatus Pacearchaeota archaeon]